MIEQERIEGANTGRREGRREGLLEGQRTGRLEGVFDSVDNVMANLNVTLEKACSIIGCNVDEYNKFKGLA
jgi:flagellar biosynthesis/type III secretory pathway protein FliH